MVAGGEGWQTGGVKGTGAPARLEAAQPAKNPMRVRNRILYIVIRSKRVGLKQGLQWKTTIPYKFAYKKRFLVNSKSKGMGNLYG